MNKPLVIIAGYGYLGKQIAQEFKSNGWNTIGLSRTESEETRACDISEKSDLDNLQNEFPSPNVIIHCASSGRGGGIEAYQKVYRQGCQNLCDAFLNSKIIYTSSTSVYGEIDGSEVTETTVARPAAETGKILLEAEKIILENQGIVTRLAGIYGPERSVLLKKFLRSEAVIEEGGYRHLNQIHRDDAAHAIVHLATQDFQLGEIFNLCDSTPLQQKELYKALATKLDQPLPPEGPRDLTKKRGWTNKRVSNAKLRKIGWQPQFPSFLDAIDSVLPTIEALEA